MSSLREVMEPMHALLRGQLSPEDLAARFGVPASRARIYQRAARGHLDDVLARNYATLMEVLGPETWQRVTDGFFQERPPADFELNACVEALPEYLAALAARGEPEIRPVHCEIAQLEWLEFAVYVSRATPPAPFDAPALNPTLEVLQADYPVADFLEAWREPGSHPPLPEATAPQTVLVFRDLRTDSYRSEVADAELLLALKVVHDGLEVSSAADQAGVSTEVVQGALARAVEVGVVIVPAEGGAS